MLRDVGKPVTLSSLLLTAILADARRQPGCERCGLLLGRGRRIVEHRPAANVASDPTSRFELDPATLFAALRMERGGGLAVLGHYHFHPHGPAEPSATDAASADPDGRLWLIVAADAHRLWRAVAAGDVHGRFEPVELRVDAA